MLAGLLTATVAAAGAESRRREQALLRTRGATTRQLVGLAAIEALVVGALGAGVGLGVAAVVGRVAFGTARFGSTSTTAIVWAVVAAASSASSSPSLAVGAAHAHATPEPTAS